MDNKSSKSKDWQSLLKKREKVIAEMKNLHKQGVRLDKAIRESNIKHFIKERSGKNERT